MKRSQAFLFFLLFTSISSVGAQSNKVVVIPMAGDNVFLSQQYERFAEHTNANNAGCLSNVYTTPNRPTQVMLRATAAIDLSALENFFFAHPLVSKDGGSFNSFLGQHSISGGSAGTWVESSNQGVLELDPNSEYQFQVNYSSAPAHSLSICTLLLGFSNKESNIVSITPAIVTSTSEVTEGKTGGPLPGRTE